MLPRAVDGDGIATGNIGVSEHGLL
jgi:hypothetical protein